MWAILGLGVVFVILASWILPWTNRSRINRLEEEVLRLRSLITTSRPIVSQVADKPAPVTKPLETPPPVQIKAPPIVVEKPVFVAPTRREIPPIAPRQPFSFERVFGAKLPVWFGGIALALAGFFMVKYSIEIGLLNERVRTMLGILFGCGLIAAGRWVREKDNFANGKKISQAMTGAGIADLYVCIYAATNVYHIFPQFLGFLAMAAITASAVALSIRHGAPIAIMGMIGGFLTPALMSTTESHAGLLFMYLYFVLAGLMFVIRRENWWMMAFPTVIGAFAWVCIWLDAYYVPGSAIDLGLFLIAISVTFVATSNDRINKELSDDPLCWPKMLNYMTLGGALILMAVINEKADYGMTEWALYGLLSLGGIALAHFNRRLYSFLPVFSMFINMIMLLAWENGSRAQLAVVIVDFAAIYIVSGYYLMRTSKKPLSWAALTAVTAITYYLLAYARLHTVYNLDEYFWGFVALIFSGASILAVMQAESNLDYDAITRQRVMGIFAATCSAFLTIALTIVLKHEYLSVAVATEVMVISWINLKADLKELRRVAGALTCLFAILLIPQITLLIQLTVYSLTEQQLALQEGIPLVDWPLFQLGLPAIMFAISSKFLCMEKDGFLVKSMEVAAIALIGVMGYYLTRHAFHINENVLFVKASFIERGVITNILFIYGLACLFVGRRLERGAILKSGIVLCAVSLFRIVYFDLLIYNPLWVLQDVGETFFINGLLLPYGLPAIWSYLAGKELEKSGYKTTVKFLNTAILGFIFVFVSLNVKQAFQGGYLNDEHITNAETYAYSIVWLLLGLAFLLAGTVKNNQSIRTASLLLMILAVGKVFLYDASELSGLYRVFSFFGLGMSLLGLSWFYTRFVFGSRSVISR